MPSRLLQLTALQALSRAMIILHLATR